MDDFQAFQIELYRLLTKYNYTLCTSGYDDIQVWKHQEGEDYIQPYLGDCADA